MAYASLSDVRAYIKAVTAETADDTLITAMITGAQQIIDTICHRTFECSSHYVRYYDASYIDGQYLYLDHDLAAVTSIKNADTAQTAITSGQYWMYPINGSPKWAIKLKEDYYWEFADGDSLVEIDGTWCYASSVPADIAHACIRLTAFLYRQKDNSNDLDRPIMSPDGAMLLPGSLPKDVMDILRPYVKVIL